MDVCFSYMWKFDFHLEPIQLLPQGAKSYDSNFYVVVCLMQTLLQTVKPFQNVNALNQHWDC